MGFTDETARFGFDNSRRKEVSKTSAVICRVLEEKDYNSISQIVGYLFLGDPTYTLCYRNTRNLICRHERDEIMGVVVKDYLSNRGVNLWE